MAGGYRLPASGEMAGGGGGGVAGGHSLAQPQPATASLCLSVCESEMGDR